LPVPPSAGSPALPEVFKTPLPISLFPHFAASLLPLPRAPHLVSSSDAAPTLSPL
jgi:hypothetical protein